MRDLSLSKVFIIVCDMVVG